MDDKVLELAKAMTYNEVAEVKQRVEWLGLITQLQNLIKSKQPDIEQMMAEYNKPAEIFELYMQYNQAVSNIIESLHRKEQDKLARKFHEEQGVQS
jgi:arginine utilization protein RocB|tara:strand:+ start:236 stop:523 length:288 start_codon:yes stop_codon:yes gene_type:complete